MFGFLRRTPRSMTVLERWERRADDLSVSVRQHPEGTLVVSYPLYGDRELAWTDTAESVINTYTAIRDRNRHPLANPRASLACRSGAERAIGDILLKMTTGTTLDRPVVEDVLALREAVERVHESEPGTVAAGQAMVELHEHVYAIQRAVGDPQAVKSAKESLAHVRELAAKQTAA